MNSAHELDRSHRLRDRCSTCGGASLVWWVEGVAGEGVDELAGDALAAVDEALDWTADVEGAEIWACPDCSAVGVIVAEAFGPEPGA